MRRLLVALALGVGLLGGSLAEAACTGSSPSWTSTPDQASVATCVSNASHGDTINVTAGDGTETWTSPPDLPGTKGLNVIGPGAANLIVTLNTATWELTCSTGKPHRVSGFTFTGSFEPLMVLRGTCTGWRIDHNAFSVTTGEYLTINAIIDLVGPLYGVFDHNTVTGANNSRVNMNAYPIDYGVRGNWAPGTRLGVAENIYFEDNTYTFSTQSDVGTGVTDSNSGSAWVFRFNSVTNNGVKSHGVCNAEGTANQSVYYNTFTCNSGVTTCDRSIHQQGSGEAVYFGNRFTASGSKSAGTIEVLHYRSGDTTAAGCSLYPRCDGNVANAAWDGNTTPTGTYYGWPCRYQPGTRATASGTGTVSSPQYVWDNAWTDTAAQVTVSILDAFGVDIPPSVQTHVQLDRDIYEAVSPNAQTASGAPFNGTTGMGFGLRAYRPSTCTAGVGYWSTDRGKWRTDTPGVADGRLDLCTAANTWTDGAYVPYCYPHPLVSGIPCTKDPTYGDATSGTSHVIITRVVMVMLLAILMLDRTHART